MQGSALEDREALQEGRAVTLASSGKSASKPTKGLELEHSQFPRWNSVAAKGLRILTSCTNCYLHVTNHREGGLQASQQAGNKL